jgi:hypothetical protein
MHFQAFFKHAPYYAVASPLTEAAHRFAAPISLGAGPC